MRSAKLSLVAASVLWSGRLSSHFELMVQLNQAAWGTMEEEVRWYKGPPSLALTEHWNYTDRDKDFFGGYCYMSQAPLLVVWAGTQAGRGLWGDALVREMAKYNHQAGLKIVGETLPQESNRVTLSEEKDAFGLPVARVGFDAQTSVVDADCRSWDIPNLWICDGSVFPTVGGVNPSLTI